MGSDSPPDDARLPGDYLSSIRERRAPIRCPSHLPDTRLALHALHSQLRRERLAAQAGDEKAERAQERPTLLRSESLQSRRNRGSSSCVGAYSSSAGGTLLRCATKSSSLLKTTPRPAAISASASRSFACQSGVQNHAWSGSIGPLMIPRRSTPAPSTASSGSSSTSL